MGDDTRAPGRRAVPRAAGRSRLTLLALALIGGWTPLAIAAGQSVALRMDDLGADTADYSLVVAAGWAVSLISLPLMGHISDRAVARGISRRLLVLLGGAAMLAAFALLGLPSSLPLFAAAWLLAQIPTALIVTAGSARLANEAPVELRSWAASAAALGPVIGITIGAAVTLLVSGVESWIFLAPAVVGFVLLLPAVFLRPINVGESAAGSGRDSDAPRVYPWSLLLTIALAFSGLAVGRIYLVPLIESLALGQSDSRVTALSSTTLLIATAGAIVGTVTSGRLLRQGERSLKAFGWFTLAAALPLTGLALAGSVGQVMALAGVFGVAIGAVSTAVYGIYVHRFAHRQDTARILGLIVAAETVPYVIVPLLAAFSQASSDSALIPVLFVIGAALAMLASLLILFRIRNS